MRMVPLLVMSREAPGSSLNRRVEPWSTAREETVLPRALSSVRSEFPVTCTLSKFWSVPRKLAV